MTAHANRRGFTILELLVVIGIIVLLCAIVLSFYGNARDSQKRWQSSSNLRILTTALKQYQLDEGGLPPFDPAVAAMFYDHRVNGTALPAPPPGGWPTGLWALLETGALSNPTALHDPNATEVCVLVGGVEQTLKSGTATEPIEEAFFYCSYQTYDPEVDEWMYLPHRGDEGALGVVNYKRQLWPFADGSGQRRWMPADSTVVLWSVWHRKGANGVTPVLYWDGNVQNKRSFLTDSDPAFIDYDAE